MNSEKKRRKNITNPKHFISSVHCLKLEMDHSVTVVGSKHVILDFSVFDAEHWSSMTDLSSRGPAEEKTALEIEVCSSLQHRMESIFEHNHTGHLSLSYEITRTLKSRTSASKFSSRLWRQCYSLCPNAFNHHTKSLIALSVSRCMCPVTCFLIRL